MFSPKSSVQRFCSKECNRTYYHYYGNSHEGYILGSTIIRQFECRECGKTVIVTNQKDRRTVFCCQPCEKKYWRDKTRHDYSKHCHDNNGMSSAMSIGSLIKREKRDIA